MHDALWYALTVEVGQQIDQMEVLQQQRAILPDSLGALGICTNSNSALVISEGSMDE